MGAKKILIIDDDRYIRLLMEEAFELEGFQVASARDGKEGMEKLVDVHPDIVLLDQNMPRMGGDEFMKIKRENRDVAEIPVIVISAVPDRTTGLGAVAYFPKPFDLERLLKEVEFRLH